MIENTIDSAVELIENESLCNSGCDFSLGNENDTTCSDIDQWFDVLLHHQIKRSTRNNSSSTEAISQFERLNAEIKKANEKSPQHDLNELANQMSFHNRLHQLYAQNNLKNAC